MNGAAEASQINPILFIVLFLWSTFWKGLALWKSAKYDQRNWFLANLIVNVLGILEIVYLFKFAKKKLTLGELKSFVKLGSK